MDEKKVQDAYDILQLMKLSSGDIEDATELLKEALAPEPRFYVGQPVLVSNDAEKVFWHKGFFDSYIKTPSGDIVGYQPYVVLLGEGTRWHHCKPDQDAVSLSNWIEHDGSDGDGEKIKIPDNNVLLVIFSDGKEGVFGSRSSGMQLIDGADRYCIIPLPQFID